MLFAAAYLIGAALFYVGLLKSAKEVSTPLALWVNSDQSEKQSRAA